MTLRGRRASQLRVDTNLPHPRPGDVNSGLKMSVPRAPLGELLPSPMEPQTEHVIVKDEEHEGSIIVDPEFLREEFESDFELNDKDNMRESSPPPPPLFSGLTFYFVETLDRSLTGERKILELSGGRISNNIRDVLKSKIVVVFPFARNEKLPAGFQEIVQLVYPHPCVSNEWVISSCAKGGPRPYARYSFAYIPPAEDESKLPPHRLPTPPARPFEKQQPSSQVTTKASHDSLFSEVSGPGATPDDPIVFHDLDDDEAVVSPIHGDTAQPITNDLEGDITPPIHVDRDESSDLSELDEDDDDADAANDNDNANTGQNDLPKGYRPSEPDSPPFQLRPSPTPSEWVPNDDPSFSTAAGDDSFQASDDDDYESVDSGTEFFDQYVIGGRRTTRNSAATAVKPPKKTGRKATKGAGAVGKGKGNSQGKSKGKKNVVSPTAHKSSVEPLPPSRRSVEPQDNMVTPIEVSTSGPSRSRVSPSKSPDIPLRTVRRRKALSAVRPDAPAVTASSMSSSTITPTGSAGTPPSNTSSSLSAIRRVASPPAMTSPTTIASPSRPSPALDPTSPSTREAANTLASFGQVLASGPQSARGDDGSSNKHSSDSNKPKEKASVMSKPIPKKSANPPTNPVQKVLALKKKDDERFEARRADQEEIAAKIRANSPSRRGSFSGVQDGSTPSRIPIASSSSADPGPAKRRTWQTSSRQSLPDTRQAAQPSTAARRMSVDVPPSHTLPSRIPGGQQSHWTSGSMRQKQPGFMLNPAAMEFAPGGAKSPVEGVHAPCEPRTKTLRNTFDVSGQVALSRPPPPAIQPRPSHGISQEANLPQRPPFTRRISNANDYATPGNDSNVRYNHDSRSGKKRSSDAHEDDTRKRTRPSLGA